MNAFDKTATVYDIALWPAEVILLRRLRTRLVADAQGRVLEIGAGTGANWPHYRPPARVYALDASAEMLQVARRRPCQVCAVVMQANGQALPFADETFDVALATFVFCSLPDPLQALAEIKRALRPGGRLLLMEHTRGTQPLMRWFTDVFHPAWYRLNGSCHLNRETARTVAQAGLSITNAEQHLGGFLQLIWARKNTWREGL